MGGLFGIPLMMVHGDPGSQCSECVCGVPYTSVQPQIVHSWF